MTPSSPAARRALALDVTLAVATFALALVTIASRRFDPDAARDLDALAVALTACTAAPLAARRAAPLTVFAVVTGASALLYGLSYPLGPPAGSFVALFTVASAPRPAPARRTRVAVVLAVLFAGPLTAHVISEGGFPGPQLLLGLLSWGAVWLAGDHVRIRRERIAELEEHAARAGREAERERRLAAAEERTRIARDLHDSAGHAINVILVQAGAARLLQERDPPRAAVALRTIEDVARETIGDIDRMVRALREDGGEVEPPPGLAALPALAARHGDAGLDVEVAVEGEERGLPPDVDRAAFRILQEALTNAARHGDGGARVRLGYGADALALRVVNPVTGAAPARSAGGHGIAGMRERAALLGGTLEAGRRDGRFVVSARLPVPESA